MKLVFFGLSVTSSWGNGHATTFRALFRALHRRGHRIVFFERDNERYRNNRDLPEPPFCDVILYDDWLSIAPRALKECRDADATVIGSFFPDAIAATHALLDASVHPILFYDIDTPVTLAALRRDGRTGYLQASDIPHYSAYLSFTAGPVLSELTSRFGSPLSIPLFCSVDPDLYRRTSSRPEFSCDLSYLGTYAPDRQSGLMEFLNEPALMLPARTFIVAGSMYPPDVAWSPNVRTYPHISPPLHAAFYSSSRFTLNLTRADTRSAGFSPCARLFEAAACASAILSDTWPGLSDLFVPGSEILLPNDSRDVADILTGLSEAEATRIGLAARERILAAHTSTHRASEFEDIVNLASRRPALPRTPATLQPA